MVVRWARSSICVRVRYEAEHQSATGFWTSSSHTAHMEFKALVVAIDR